MMTRMSAAAVAARRREFLATAGEAFDRMLGSDGQNGLVTFAEREDRACELGDALTRRLLEEHLSADEAADPGVDVACPICGQPVLCPRPETVDLEGRRVRTRRGTVEYERAARR